LARRLDPARLDELLAEAPEIVGELVILFADDVGQRLAELRQAVDAGDLESIKRVAHGIRGAAANIGAETMMRLAETLEYLGPSTEAGPVVGELETEFEAVSALLGQRYPGAERPAG
jgi:HPt (histidine-containing phosphotransfer) domain-containing protein